MQLLIWQTLAGAVPTLFVGRVTPYSMKIFAEAAEIAPPASEDASSLSTSNGTASGTPRAPGTPWAMVAAAALVGGEEELERALAECPAPRLIVDASPRSEPDAESAFARWGPTGLAAFDRAVDRAAAAAQRAGKTLLIRPAIGTALSDVPSTQRLLRRLESASHAEAVRILLEPSALLDGSMLPRAQEHLERCMRTLSAHPSIAGILATNLALHDDRFVRSGLHHGVLEPAWMLGSLSPNAANAMNLVLCDERVDAQIVALRHAGVSV
jgi:hypothetical protein